MARNMYTVSHGKLQCSKMTEVSNSVVVERTNHISSCLGVEDKLGLQ